MNPFPKFYNFYPDVFRALQTGKSVVALESTVITHGLPYPQNLEIAQAMEAVVKAKQAIPATIALINGNVHVGLDENELARLAAGDQMRKISVRDFGPAIAQKASGGTTVAGTLVVAEKTGIKIFATGGIGGVHRGAPFDISTDLDQLSKSPVVVVCAGAKSILDLPSTLERLETLAVPVVGYKTDEFPAFYSRDSGLKVSARADSPEEAARIAQAHWEIGGGGVLVVVPIPEADAIPLVEIEGPIQEALSEAAEQNIHGQAVTPFLLARVSELSHGSSMQANLALLKNNASVAAEISQYLYTPGGSILA
ncbi:pseudouridine-5'-phosphate glycosidase [bacterium]|nr:pseudouridine-5'-phosphate glycosidase [bacterium]